MDEFKEEQKIKAYEIMCKHCSENLQCDECNKKDFCITRYLLSLIEKDIAIPESKENMYFTCPKCKVVNLENSTFCPNCGQRLGKALFNAEKHSFKERYEEMYGKSNIYNEEWEKEDVEE